MVILGSPTLNVCPTHTVSWFIMRVPPAIVAIFIDIEQPEITVEGSPLVEVCVVIRDECVSTSEFYVNFRTVDNTAGILQTSFGFTNLILRVLFYL